MFRKKIAVIGLGDFGIALTRCLHREGHEVIAIDKNMERVEEIIDESTRSVCMDSTDEKAMKSQGIEDMDTVIIASADNLESVIVTIDITKRFGVTEIIARYKNRLQMQILTMLGITQLFNPEENAALSMAEQFSHHSMRMSTILTDEYRIAEIDTPALFVGKTVMECQIKENYRLNIITIKRKNEETNMKEKVLGIPMGETIIMHGDILILFGLHDDIDRFLEITE